jgi:hypothetical protein
VPASKLHFLAGLAQPFECVLLDHLQEAVSWLLPLRSLDLDERLVDQRPQQVEHRGARDERVIGRRVA